MRRLGSTVILLVVAVGFGAYIYFIDAEKPLTEATAKEKIFSVDTDKISQLQIKSASGDVSSLKKGANGWALVTPVEAPADQGVAADVAASLGNLEQVRVVDENAADLKTYGLAEPRIDVTFNVDGEKDARRIQIGDQSPSNTGLYAKLPNSNKVFLIASSFDSSFNRSTFELRDKKALDFTPPKVDSLELTSAKNGNIRLVKAGDQWKLVKPIEAPANLPTVEGLVGQLSTAQMTAIKESPEDLKNLKTFGLDKPDVTVTVGMGGANATLQLGLPAEGTEVWARDPSKARVFSIAKGTADELRKTAWDFRRKDLFDFRPFNTTRFEITRGKETRVFERVKGTGPNATDTWKEVAPAAKTVDSAILEVALLDFSNLRATAAIERAGPKSGLDVPAVTVTVKFDDGKKEERVTFGRPVGGVDVFAARPDQPGALVLEPAKFDEALKKLDAVK